MLVRVHAYSWMRICWELMKSFHWAEEAQACLVLALYSVQLHTDLYITWVIDILCVLTKQLVGQKNQNFTLENNTSVIAMVFWRLIMASPFTQDTVPPSSVSQGQLQQQGQLWERQLRERQLQDKTTLEVSKRCLQHSDHGQCFIYGLCLFNVTQGTVYFK